MASDEIMISLQHLAKQFPGQQDPAVEDLSLDIRAGEVVILVGPSGCGKTTTLRLINRLIEPSSGRIVLQGEDVTRVNPDELRRRIGYVIQQVGLFPHLTIADNIGITPKLLGWTKRDIAARVDELLELVGLPAGMYRKRYPKQLSGGQQQRVGVARALAADPPVLLMDEPFGAIDPITRERLQDEFLRLQAQLGKTVVFVTHDIQEAIKMGTRIALFGERARLEQYDTPTNLLARPASEFVSDFVGPGPSIKLLGLARVGDVALERCRVSRDRSGPAEGGAGPVDRSGRAEGGGGPVDRSGRASGGGGPVDRSGRASGGGGPVERSGRVEGDAGRVEGRVLHLGPSGRPQRWVLDGSGDERPVIVVDQGWSLYEVLDALLGGRETVAAVVDQGGGYLGVLHLDALTASLPELGHAQGTGVEP